MPSRRLTTFAEDALEASRGNASDARCDAAVECYQKIKWVPVRRTSERRSCGGALQRRLLTFTPRTRPVRLAASPSVAWRRAQPPDTLKATGRSRARA